MQGCIYTFSVYCKEKKNNVWVIFNSLNLYMYVFVYYTVYLHLVTSKLLIRVKLISGHEDWKERKHSIDANLEND